MSKNNKKIESVALASLENLFSKYGIYLLMTLVVGALIFLTSGEALAAYTFDLDKMASEGMKKVRTAVDNNWGKSLGLASIIGMIAKQGDLVERGKAGGIGFCIAGSVILGVLAVT